MRRLVTQSNLQYVTGENKGYHSGHHDEDEDEPAGGQAAAPQRTAEEQASHFRALTALAQRVMRMKVRRMALPVPTPAPELEEGDSPVVKAALELCGRPGGPSRLPTRELTSEEKAELREILERIGVPDLV